MTAATADQAPGLLIIDALKPLEQSFAAPLLPVFQRRHSVSFLHGNTPDQTMAQAIAAADVVWFEWCAMPPVWATRSVDLTGKRVFVRLHSTEAIDSPFPEQVVWEKVEALILVSEDIRQTLLQRIPDLERRVRVVHIPNGIDCLRFIDQGRQDRHRIAWVGDVAMKKNPMLAIQILRRLVDFDPDYRLHIAGDWTCPRTERYLTHLIPALGLDKHVVIEGRVKDMPAWYADKGVLLSTTLYESFGMNIAEAMACGAWPVVHNYPGATLTWPREVLFNSVEQAVGRVLAARPGAYRPFVVGTYSLVRQQDRLATLLEPATAPPPLFAQASQGPQTPAAPAPTGFDPAGYWENRHVAHRGSIRSVGHVGLSEDDNQADYAATFDHIAAALRAACPQPGGRIVLDAGCGVGLVSASVAGLGYTVVGVDFSATAVAQAKARVPDGLFMVKPLHELNLSVPADVVLCLDVLFHVVDDGEWRTVLANLTRAVKPGGRLLILEHFPGTPSESPHVRWRDLAAYEAALGALGLRVTAVDRYVLPRLKAEKTLLIIDRPAAGGGGQP